MVVETNINEDKESVVLVEIGITTLSGSNPLLYDIVEMKKTINSIIAIKIIPAIVLIVITLTNVKPGILSILEDNSAKNPIIGNIIIAKNPIIEKLRIVTFSGRKAELIKPEWSADDSLAPKILTRFPLSPEKRGTKVRRLGFFNNVSIELFKNPPAVTPKKEQSRRTGVDCFIIFFISPPDFIP